MKRPLPFPTLFTWIVSVLLAIALLLRWQISVLKPFDPDELAQLHYSWLITHGSLPYKDFFTGYPPTFAILLSPFLLLPPSDFIPVLVRQGFFLLFLSSLFLLYKISRFGLDRKFSLVVVFLTSLSVLSLERGVEIRSDNLLIPLWLASVYLISTSRKPRSLFLAGLVTGLAQAITQKAVYGTAFVLVVLFFSQGLKWVPTVSDLKAKLLPLSKFFLGFLLVPLLIFIFLVYLGLGSFLYDSLIKYPLNLSQIYQWDHPWYILGFVKGFTSFVYFTYLYKDSLLWLRENQVLWLLAALSFPILLRRTFSKSIGPAKKPFFLILLSGLTIFTVYVLTIHVKLPQYYLFISPFVSILAVFGLSEITQTWPKITKPLLVVILLGLALTELDVIRAWEKDLPTNSNQRQRADIKAVLAYTSPQAAGYDGLGSYIYRKDCYYFGMVIPQEIPHVIFYDILEDFQKGKCTFVLDGLFGRMNHWNLDENSFVSKNFTTVSTATDLHLLKP